MPDLSLRSTRRIVRALCLLGSIPLLATLAGAAHATAAGAVPATTQDPAAVTQRPCFGAAARSPIARCDDPSLRRTVFPTPDDALLEPNAPCRPLRRANLLYPCSFGADAAPSATAVLVGDSHAAHWRAAVDIVAQARGWHALSLTRSGCSFNDAQAIIPAEQAASCRRWNRQVVGWLDDHPEVATLFVSTRANARYVPSSRRSSSFEIAVQGHLARWRRLPATVKDVFVIRDTPYSSAAAADCTRRAHARRQLAGIICARRRHRALHRDPAVTAARRLGSARVRVVDMTSYFCDPDRCFPVVGGALVHKDADHITATFARTLGHFMLPLVAGA